MDTQLVYFTILAVGLSFLVFFMVTSQNLFAFVQETARPVQDKPHITVGSYGVVVRQSAAGDDFQYTVTVNADVILNEQKEAVIVAPVIIFKGVEKRAQAMDSTGSFADTFTIQAGERAAGHVFHASILTSIPPLQRIDSRGTRTFTEGFPYVFEDQPGSGSNFKMTLNQISVVPVRGQEVCAAQFLVECARTIRTSSPLTGCAAGSEDESCRDSVELCGAIVTMIVRVADCAGRKATVDYETDCRACTPWPAMETAVIYFFRVDPENQLSSCVFTRENLFEQQCYPDFLGGTALYFDPSIIS